MIHVSQDREREMVRETERDRDPREKNIPFQVMPPVTLVFQPSFIFKQHTQL